MARWLGSVITRVPGPLLVGRSSHELSAHQGLETWHLPPRRSQTLSFVSSQSLKAAPTPALLAPVERWGWGSASVDAASLVSCWMACPGPRSRRAPGDAGSPHTTLQRHEPLFPDSESRNARHGPMSHSPLPQANPSAGIPFLKEGVSESKWQAAEGEGHHERRRQGQSP